VEAPKNHHEDFLIVGPAKAGTRFSTAGEAEGLIQAFAGRQSLWFLASSRFSLCSACLCGEILAFPAARSVS
jgi:hypothetical protein